MFLTSSFFFLNDIDPFFIFYSNARVEFVVGNMGVVYFCYFLFTFLDLDEPT